VGGHDLSFSILCGQDQLFSSTTDIPFAVLERKRFVAVLLDDIAPIPVYMGCNNTTRRLCELSDIRGTSYR
jgi:hypothetical protein